MSAGKGDHYRPVDKKKFDENYDRIFKQKCEVNNKCHLCDKIDSCETIKDIELYQYYKDATFFAECFYYSERGV
jgi:hypothetical protein